MATFLQGTSPSHVALYSPFSSISRLLKQNPIIVVSRCLPNTAGSDIRDPGDDLSYSVESVLLLELEEP